MKNFISVNDIGPWRDAVREALEIKADRFAHQHLGRNRTLFYAGWRYAVAEEIVAENFKVIVTPWSMGEN